MLRIIFLTFCFVTTTLATPNIVVSIKPIHSIVSNLTQGVTKPKLLIKDNQSAHHFHLKPSQISLLNQADLVIAVHPSIEEGIVKLLNNMDAQRKLYVVENSAQKHSQHEHGEYRHHEKKNHEDHEEYEDYHVWLSIDAMRELAIRLNNKLIAMDVDNRLIYQANLTTFKQKLNTLQTQIKKQLLPYQGTSMLTYSNAFEYFIKTNKLKKLTTVVTSHEQKPNIKNILDARKIIRSKNVQCLISSTEVTPKKIDIIVENFDIKQANVDIMGFNHSQGSAHYFTLMQNISNAFEQCLK